MYRNNQATQIFSYILFFKIEFKLQEEHDSAMQSTEMGMLLIAAPYLMGMQSQKLGTAVK